MSTEALPSSENPQRQPRLELDTAISHDAPVVEINALARKPRAQWSRGLDSIQRLLAEPDETGHAMDLNYAIDRPAFERQLRRLASDPVGRRLLGEASSLSEALGDREALAALPEGSFGRVYLAYLDANGFDGLALLDIAAEVRKRWEDEDGEPQHPHRRWLRERMLLCHDLFHVLTDYGTDDIGEATLLGFSLAQTPCHGSRLLTFGASLRVAPRVGWRWWPYLFAAWRRGRRARWLVAFPFEEALALPLESVRALCGVAPSRSAHPAGIYRSQAA